MKRFINLHFAIALHLVLVALFVTAGAWFAHAAKAAVREQIQINIDRQVAHMHELANITDRNGADETISAIIADCPKRNEFEVLLVRLGTLDKKELIEVQQLFESCGSFYAERKALMVSRFEREFNVLKDNFNLLRTLDAENGTDEILAQWERIIALERERSGLLNEQVTLQQTIITALVAGKKTNSKDVSESVQRAQKIGESLSVLDKQIDDIRGELVS